jgi:hypothetical protein
VVVVDVVVVMMGGGGGCGRWWMEVKVVEVVWVDVAVMCGRW